MADTVADRGITEACRSLEGSQGFSVIFEKLLAIDIDGTSPASRDSLLSLLARRARSSDGPLLLLGLPQQIQAEISLFSGERFPGIDRNAYLRATPKQVIRRLIAKSNSPSGKDLCNKLLEKYHFSRFGRDDWKEYFSKCLEPLPFAKKFLLKDEKSGGFTDAEITDLALQNPQMIECIPPARLAPNTVVALLISGRAESLWKTYDFSRFQKAHWREVFLHTNPAEMPAASKPYVENKDGKGFNADELLQFALKCHSLINSLDPNKVPFSVAYELYQTGRADILWANYPFAQLDKTEWKKILENPSVKIPEMFAEVLKGKRFKIEELCSLALKNERLLPFLVAADIPADNIVDLLLKVDAEYIWDNYHFRHLGLDQWKRLVLGLSAVVRPRAMSALSACKEITPELATEFIRKNTAYCPYVPVVVIPPVVAVEVLVQGKGHCLWNTYDFSRLSNDLWLDLLGGIDGEIPPVAEQFLRNQSFVPEQDRVDADKLNAFLIKNENLIKYVDAQLIDPKVAFSLISNSPRHELWDRYDFKRFTAGQLVDLLKKTVRQGDWPDSLRTCFQDQDAPLGFGDVLEIMSANAPVVVDLISYEWIDKIDESLFDQFVTIAGRSGSGVEALARRMQAGKGSWRELPMLKLKSVLSVLPSLREHVEWKSWPYRVIAELATAQPVFENEVAHPNIYFVWKHWKSLIALLGLTILAFVLLRVQHIQLEQERVQKAHWSDIVAKVSGYDRANAYAELERYFVSLSSQDMANVSNDLLVVNANANLNEWRSQQSKNDVLLDELKSIVDGGLAIEKVDRIKIILKSLEESRAEIGLRKVEYHSLRNKCECFIRDQSRKAAVEAARQKLQDIGSRCGGISTLTDLEHLKVEVNLAREYAELATDVAEAIRKIDARIEKIRHDQVIKNITIVSNAVEGVAILLRNEGASKMLPTIKTKFDTLAALDGFLDYTKACKAHYETVRDSISLFVDLMRDVALKDSEADCLNRKFALEFLTVEGGAECSNLVFFCEGQIAKAKGVVGLTDAISAYETIRKKVKDLEDRDIRAWNLVDKLNETRDYAEYLRIRQELIRDFSGFAQLRSFARLNVLSLEDANAVHKVSTGSYWSSKKSVRYHFVGLIRLMPGEPKKVHIAIDNTKITASADLYCLTRYGSSAYSSVTEKLLIQQSGRGKYYRMDNVNYDGYQGVPLFVKEEHYMGGGK